MSSTWRRQDWEDLPCAERQILQFRICVVHDFRAQLDGVFRRLACARGIAGER
jgi:hypothetical protein